MQRTCRPSLRLRHSCTCSRLLHLHARKSISTVEVLLSSVTALSGEGRFVDNVVIRIGRTMRLPSRRAGLVLACSGAAVLAASFLVSVLRTGGDFVFLYGSYQFILQGLVFGSSYMMAYGFFAAEKGRVRMLLAISLSVAVLSTAAYLLMTAGIRSYPPASYGNPVPGLVSLAGLASYVFVFTVCAYGLLIRFRKGTSVDFGS